MRFTSLFVLSIAAACGGPSPPSSDGSAAVDGAALPDASVDIRDAALPDLVVIDLSPPVDRITPPDLTPPPPDFTTLAINAPGYLNIQAYDDLTHLPIPVRVNIAAVPPTPAARFDVFPNGSNGDAGGYGVVVSPGVVGAVDGLYLTNGSGTFPIPAGTYDLFITHGPEWEAHSERITLGGPTSPSIVAYLRHSVDTGGWLSADLHIHTGRSYDSKIDLNQRVISEVAVGTELLVITDHNIFTDLQPQIDNLGYTNFARSIPGDEFNFDYGHGGAYPSPYDSTDPIYGGAKKLMLDCDLGCGYPSPDIFDRVHQLSTHPVVTINHPRLPGLGYFVNQPGQWAPPAPLPTANRFDALEVMNGYGSNPGSLAVLIRDWFFLLSTGNRLTALGSSDTHRFNDARAGFPRTWLRAATDDPTKFSNDDLADALRNHRGIASTGPFALLTVDKAQIGDLVTNTTGMVNVSVTVDAPDWIAVDKAKLYVNGVKLQEFTITPGTRPLLQKQIAMTIPTGDAWMVLIATGAKALPTPLVGGAPNTMFPIAMTNPVYIDGDGDGQWIPKIANPDPGPLPAPPPPPGFKTWDDPALLPALELEPLSIMDVASWSIPELGLSPAPPRKNLQRDVQSE